MKRIVALVVSLVFICAFFTSCNEAYIGNYQLENVTELGEGADFTLEIKNFSFEMIMSNGNQQMVVTGKYNKDSETEISLVPKKKLLIDSDGDKAQASVDASDALELTFEDNKLVAKDSTYVFVKTQ